LKFSLGHFLIGIGQLQVYPTGGVSVRFTTLVLDTQHAGF